MHDALQVVTADTLTRGDAAFIHQHVMDAWTAQTADAQTPPLRLFFAVVGLYLCVERGITGREVQRVHAELARVPERWPLADLPADRGWLRVEDIAAAEEIAARDALIHAWVRVVWAAYGAWRPTVEGTLRRRGVV